MSTRCLVSTTHYLLAADPEEGKVWLVHSGKGLYFGLAPSPDGDIYVACRNETQGAQDVSARVSEHGSILMLDRSFSVCDELIPPFPLRDLHGIACFDDRIWATCSFDNMVAIYEIRTGRWSRWYPAPSPGDRDRDVHHFNTVRRTEQQVCLVAHRFGASHLMFYDYPDLQLSCAIALGRLAHDVLPLGDAVATCSSADGWIEATDGGRLRTGGFPRGFAATDNCNVVGISLHATRLERARQDAILRIYSKDWCFRRDVVLPRVGMVLDILAPGKREYEWEALEPWTQAVQSEGSYSEVCPGNVYALNGVRGHRGGFPADTPGWHPSEESLSWTAAKSASVPVIINPGESAVKVEISNWHPAPYSTEIWLEQVRLGTMLFDRPGMHAGVFQLHGRTAGPATLSFRVPFLWRPADHDAQNTDERLLGIAVHSVTFI